MNLEIKPKYYDQIVGYNGKSLPLLGRDDLYILAEIGLRSNCESILDYFIKRPTLEDLKTLITEKLLLKYGMKDK